MTGRPFLPPEPKRKSVSFETELFRYSSTCQWEYITMTDFITQSEVVIPLSERLPRSVGPRKGSGLCLCVRAKPVCDSSNCLIWCGVQFSGDQQRRGAEAWAPGGPRSPPPVPCLPPLLPAIGACLCTRHDHPAQRLSTNSSTL